MVTMMMRVCCQQGLGQLRGLALVADVAGDGRTTPWACSNW
jgi:hypothetical protein